MKNQPPSSHLPLSVPVFQILVSLGDTELHGYAIIKDIRERTEGEVSLTASTLYAAVKRMLAAGMIRETSERPDRRLDDTRRRYYAITPYGRNVLELEAVRLDRAAAMARAKLAWK